MDCTGDAAVCAAAGVPWEQGYEGMPLGMAVDLVGLRSAGKESLLLDGDVKPAFEMLNHLPELPRT